MSNWVVPSWVVPHYGVYNVADDGGVIDPSQFVANLLLEDGGNFLLEDGRYLLLETQTAING